MDTKKYKTRNIVIYKNNKPSNLFYYYRDSKNIIHSVKDLIYKQLITLKLIHADIKNFNNIILINLKFNSTLPESFSKFKFCFFENIDNKSVLNLKEFGTIELTNISYLPTKTFTCFVSSNLNTINILLIDSESPNFIYKNGSKIKFINFLPNKTIFNMPCNQNIFPISFSNFSYISKQLNKYTPWEFLGKRLLETAILLVDKSINGKVLGSLQHQTSFIKDLYIISTSLTPSKSNVNLELVNIKVVGSLFIILPDNYEVTLKYSNLNVIKQL